jgi:hypothetical protein
VSPALEAAVRRALAADPRERFTSMDDFRAALGSTPEGVAASVISSGRRDVRDC